MEDEAIVMLYWERQERAIAETEIKYGGLCRSLAQRVLASPEDTEECVSDTWLRTWNSIPPQRPKAFGAFLCAITRNLALDRYRRQTAQKRGSGEIELALEELGECVSGETMEEKLQLQLLTDALNGFLHWLKPRDRELFLRRYWSLEPLRELARREGLSENALSVRLHRLRVRLREYLDKEGIEL